MIRYLRSLTLPRIILWGYLIWYLYALVLYFEPSTLLWLNSLGISAIIGTGLVLSTAYAGSARTALDRWQTFRLYLMPFCVSSFAALIKGRGFVLVFHPKLTDNAIALCLVAGFVMLVRAARESGASANARESLTSAASTGGGGRRRDPSPGSPGDGGFGTPVK